MLAKQVLRAENGANWMPVRASHTSAISGRYYLEKWYRTADRRYLLPTCLTRLLVPEKVVILGAYPAVLNDRAFVHLDGIGLLRGTISRAMGSIITMDVEMFPNDRSRLAAQILWLDIRVNYRATDRRLFPRYRPRDANSILTFPDNSQADCTIVNISPAGAAIMSELRPELHSRIILGQVHGEIERHMKYGFAIGFSTIQDPSTLDELVSRPRADFDDALRPDFVTPRTGTADSVETSAGDSAAEGLQLDTSVDEHDEIDKRLKASAAARAVPA